MIGVYVAMPLAGELRETANPTGVGGTGIGTRFGRTLTERRLRAEIRAAWQLAQRSRTSWEQANDAAQRFERYAGLAARAYALGESSLSDLLLARRQALDARRVEAEVRAEALLARWRLELGRATAYGTSTLIERQARPGTAARREGRAETARADLQGLGGMRSICPG